MLRKCFIVVSIVVSSCSHSSEFDIKEEEVPPNVLTVFKAKYPQAQETKWEAEKEEGKFYFEVDFKVDGKKKEAHITPDGSLVVED